MNSLIDLIINKGSIIDLIIFMLGMAVVAYVGILKHRLDKKERQIAELKEKYHLLDRHTLIMSHNLSLAIKRPLHKQMPGSEWTTHNPLTED
jgi:hypothetical protein